MNPLNQILQKLGDLCLDALSQLITCRRPSTVEYVTWGQDLNPLFQSFPPIYGFIPYSESKNDVALIIFKTTYRFKFGCWTTRI